MPLESFRFIHAAGLQLDHQLEGVPSLSKPARAIAEEATLLAFEQIIDACVAHDVDFLLLAGNSFDQHDAGVRGQARLAGLERLVEHNIDTFIIAGDRDPWPAWLSGVRYSEGVEFLGRDQHSSAPVHVHGKPVALVFPLIAPAGNPPAANNSAAGASATEDFLPIGMIHGQLTQLSGTMPTPDTADAAGSPAPRIKAYQAWGGGERHACRIGDALAHDPGMPQAIDPRQPGPHGCTFVEVDTTGAVKLELIPTAAVRWERCTLSIAPEMQSADDIQAAMQAALNEINRYDSDRLWLVTWTLHADVPLPDLLCDTQARQELFDRLCNQVGIENVIVATQDICGPASPIENRAASPADALIGEYLELVTDRFGGEQWSASQCLSDSVLHDGPWEPRLEGLVPRLERQRIEECARRLGQEWFAVEQESSP